ncbi:DUF2637 domain-containing protein [Streptomyces beijiangensis]|uniref:DUF2637 domain-containing protein n=1 Tax=Streptomyces beijiangensis TaxID=163361 RepID=A0A939F7S5_9ACTN|nr:DUF2637 domain-containing protein [Streptomyces beijiangensis]MBO0513386.1 DUF2637 domain-containing protein [Streptomyces beijiangensis]
MTKQDAERYALGAAGIVIIALTAGAFWLSYAHLAGVAGQHGLGGSRARRWAWPATLDAFILAGELLMLRAGLRHVTDIWAIGVTAIGSAGSIALNVAGVSGTNNGHEVPLLGYVVAAVPPAAAMVAFGVLMRQIHQLVEEPGERSDQGSPRGPKPPATTSVQPAEVSVERVGPAGQRVEPGQVAELPAAVSGQHPQLPAEAAEGKRRGGPPPGAPLEDLVEIGRIAAAEQGGLTRAVVRKAVTAKGLTVGSKRLTEVMEVLRAEFEADADVGPADG